MVLTRRRDDRPGDGRGGRGRRRPRPWPASVTVDSREVTARRRLRRAPRRACRRPRLRRGRARAAARASSSSRETTRRSARRFDDAGRRDIALVRVGDTAARARPRSRDTTARGCTAPSSPSPARPARPRRRTSSARPSRPGRNVVATEGNRNNELGVPADDPATRISTTDVVVVEMGMRGHGPDRRAVRDRAAHGGTRHQRRARRTSSCSAAQERDRRRQGGARSRVFPADGRVFLNADDEWTRAPGRGRRARR